MTFPTERQILRKLIVHLIVTRVSQNDQKIFGKHLSTAIVFKIHTVI